MADQNCCCNIHLTIETDKDCELNMGDTSSGGSLPSGGQDSAILKNVNGVSAKWTDGIFAVEREGSPGVQGQAVLSVGSKIDEYSEGGYVGAFRIFRGSGEHGTRITLSTPRPTETIDRHYLFGTKTPNASAHVVSSTTEENTSGAIAKFDGGSSIVSGILESSIEQNTNKVTELSSQSTDAQYPSAKAVYDKIKSIYWIGTQQEYDAMSSHNPETLYFIVEEIGVKIPAGTYTGITSGIANPLEFDIPIPIAYSQGGGEFQRTASRLSADLEGNIIAWRSEEDADLIGAYINGGVFLGSLDDDQFTVTAETTVSQEQYDAFMVYFTIVE